MQITKHTFTVSDDLSFNVRSVLRDGEPWFVAKDVADALGYENSRKALADHVEEEDKLTVTERDAQILTGSNMARSAVIVNESGLYSLVMGSRLERAKAFKRWVTKEVLPSIRKHGAYVVGMEELPEIAKADVAEIARKEVVRRAARIGTVCYSKESYNKKQWDDIGIALCAAEAIHERRGGDDILALYREFAKQLTLYKVPFRKNYEKEAIAHFNEAFRIELVHKREAKNALQKYEHGFSSHY